MFLIGPDNHQPSKRQNMRYSYISQEYTPKRLLLAASLDIMLEQCQFQSEVVEAPQPLVFLVLGGADLRLLAGLLQHVLQVLVAAAQGLHLAGLPFQFAICLSDGMLQLLAFLLAARYLYLLLQHPLLQLEYLAVYPHQQRIEFMFVLHLQLHELVLFHLQLVVLLN